MDRKIVVALLLPISLLGCREGATLADPPGTRPAEGRAREDPSPGAPPECRIPRAGAGTDRGVHYAGEAPEMVTWGPKSFAIDPGDGSFWIADTVAERILHADGSGIRGAVDVSKDAVGAIAVAVNATHLAVLSVASQPPRALRYTRAGALVARHDLPTAWQGSVTGLDLDDDGTLTVERAYGHRRDALAVAADGSVSFSPRPATAWDDETPSPYDRYAVAPVDARNAVTLRRFLGAFGGATYVYVEEYRDGASGRAIVDATVRRFDRAAESTGLARVPLRDRYTFVEPGGVRYDPASDGVLALMTDPTGVAIVPLPFAARLEPLPDWEVAADEPGADAVDGAADPGLLARAAGECLSGAAMVQVALSMATAEWIPPAGPYSVITQSAGCASRTIPRYLPADGIGPHLAGVSYSWGDCDDAAEFSAYMSAANATNAYKAGDANGDYTVPTSCGRGTDCSGLITRTWGRACPGQKLSTRDIAKKSYTSADAGAWDQGEVFVKAGAHVVMFDAPADGGLAYWYESTTDAHYDRVVRTLHPASYYSGYAHRRFVGQCL